MEEFDQKVRSFVAGCQEIVGRYFADQYPTLAVPTIELMDGIRYVRVVRKDGSSCSVHAFIDRQTGDVLKPAGWKHPEKKNPRGNVFDDSNGLAAMTPWGTAYLRR